MSGSLSPEEIRAAAEVHDELGPRYRDAVIDSFLEKVGNEIDARVAARLGQASLGQASLAPMPAAPPSAEQHARKHHDHSGSPLALAVDARAFVPR